MSSHRTDLIRIAFALLALMSTLFFMWWLPLVFMTLSALRWRAWEVPLIGLFADFLWLPATGFAYVPLMTLFGIAVVWALEPLRARFLLS